MKFSWALRDRQVVGSQLTEPGHDFIAIGAEDDYLIHAAFATSHEELSIHVKLPGALVDADSNVAVRSGNPPAAGLARSQQWATSFVGSFRRGHGPCCSKFEAAPRFRSKHGHTGPSGRLPIV